MLAGLLVGCGTGQESGEPTTADPLSPQPATNPTGTTPPTTAGGSGEGPPGDASATEDPPAEEASSPGFAAPGPEPVAFSIPAIDASSDLLHLGLRADGTAEVPEDFGRASWYDLGGRPGGSGLPTAILGHVDSTSGPAVFFRLRDLRPGDEIEITLADGAIAVYAVTGTEQYPKDELPTAAVFGATTDDVVHLVTCSGEFDRGARSYTDNLVVSAERIR